MSERLNPGHLELDLFCKGIRIDPSCDLENDARSISKVRAGLGSGLEVVLESDLWMNIPVEEHFVKDSPYLLIKRAGQYIVQNGELEYPVRLPPRPKFYDLATSRGTPMSRIGAMQGTYLGMFPSKVCGYWKDEPRTNCRFCATGIYVGKTQEEEMAVQDVIETARAAKEECGVTFFHFNTGFYDGSELDVVEPYVRAIKESVGGLVGVQCPPNKDLKKYDRLHDLGVDHLSFCVEFWNPEFFAKYCPGKEATLGQKAFFDAIEYTAKLWGKGRTSGEIIAGIEPVADTLAAIDWMTGIGAFPTVCVFRPVLGTDMEDAPSPKYEEMVPVFRRVFEKCMEHGFPIGAAPNLEVSLVVQPTDARWFVPHDLRYHLYMARLKAMKTLFAPFFRIKLMPANPLVRFLWKHG